MNDAPALLTPLPPGQSEAGSFCRFGLGRFQKAKIDPAACAELAIGGDVAHHLSLSSALADLPRHEQQCDFHCVTTWSVRNLHWGGVLFRDFYEQTVVADAQPASGAEIVVFRGVDGYCCAMLLEDLLADDVMLADMRDGKPLCTDHGAPMRLIAPAHYGYKSVKYIIAIEFWRTWQHYRFPAPYPSLMDHPRARVAHEERAKYLPNWLLRPIYKMFVPRAIWRKG